MKKRDLLFLVLLPVMVMTIFLMLRVVEKTK
jgi:hypothetical protein